MTTKKLGLAAVCMLLTAIAATTYGYTFDDVDLEYWAGSGDKEAVMVVDFDTGYNYAFGYRWDGAAIGWDAMDTIDQAGALNVDATWYDLYSTHFVNDFDYPGATKGAGTSWGYYTSTDGENWTASGSGVDSRVLNDGDYDGWSWGSTDANWDHLRAPTTPVPEPATVSLLALGGMVLLRRGKK
jgi:hypothetical protein